jgi:peptidoglycan/xylan/chitin deacetylase (PgdA/CDA1 family)
MQYFIKTPWLIKKIWPSYIWSVDTKEKKIYLTFDDGPHPVATPFVLDTLKRYNAKATFFCIGKNVVEQPDLYQRILDEGHSTGNHTHHHLNGWKTKEQEYIDDVTKAAAYIDTRLFRPPYGRIRSVQAKKILAQSSIIMWTVLSGDFDKSLSKEQCLKNVIRNTKAGSIVVFHDSEKAFPLLEYVLPVALDFFSEKGFRFEPL